MLQELHLRLVILLTLINKRLILLTDVMHVLLQVQELLSLGSWVHLVLQELTANQLVHWIQMQLVRHLLVEVCLLLKLHLLILCLLVLHLLILHLLILHLNLLILSGLFQL